MAGENRITDQVALAGRTPLERLQLAATGDTRVQLEDLQAILAEHVVAADRRTKELDDHCGALLEMLTSMPEEGEKPPDLAAAVQFLGTMEKVRETRLRDLRRTVELLHRISGSPRPRVQVITATQFNLNAKAQ